MTANDDALAALTTAVTANTAATEAAVKALGTPPPAGTDDISAGVATQTAAVEANTAALTAASTPVVTPPPAALTFTPAAAVSIPLGQAASFDVGTASGGTPPYTFTVTGPSAGPLPDGLSANAEGVVSGTPTATGTTELSVEVGDSAGAAVPGTVSLTIA